MTTLERVEALVIGAGPAGLLVAREMARKGLEVTVIEEHLEIGEPNHCAGLLSIEGLKRIGVEAPPSYIQNSVKGGRVISPGGIIIELKDTRDRAYVVDRAAFDRNLAEQAVDLGADIRKGLRVRELVLKDGRVEGAKGRDWEFRADVPIDAEGGARTLAGQLGLIREGGGALIGVNVEVSGVEVEPEMVEVWLGSSIAPGFFAWVIPLGDGEARCGLACKTGDAQERLERFVKKRFRNGEMGAIRGGLVFTGGPLKRTYGDGIILVGDAAGQTKPTTGGGVILGGLCAIEAGRIAADALERGNTSSSFLRSYQESWRKSLGREFSHMLAARRLFERLSDHQIDNLFRVVKEEECIGELLKSQLQGADLDMQSGIISLVLKEPWLNMILLKSLGSMALETVKRGLGI
ncbi:MAG: NAD(P)/FAD-dependent oxidoreductase [Candidatus Bathyarchaeia archaeon]